MVICSFEVMGMHRAGISWPEFKDKAVTGSWL